MNALPQPLLLPPVLAALARSLPQWPPAAALCAGLNLVLLPTLDADTRRLLTGRIVAIEVTDAGIDCRLSLTALGFVPASGRAAPDVAIRACAHDFYRLARRMEDPDTLFFARRLAIEGDTELGLTIKNALDAIDWSRLDWSRLPQPLRGLTEQFRRLGKKLRASEPLR